MSENADIVVVPYHRKVEEAIAAGMPSREFLELMMVDYLKEWAAGKPLVTISDGSTTIQCVINNPEREQPKKP